jgi:type IV secretory pathway VirB10-like protein
VAGIAAAALLITLGFLALRSSHPRPVDGPQENESEASPQSQPDTVSAPPASPAETGEKVPEQPPIPVPAPEEETAPKPPLRPDDEYGLATRQLEALQGLLRRGDLKYSPALLKAVRTVQEKAGRNTPTGVRAQKFAAEIEQQLAKQGKN